VYLGVLSGKKGGAKAPAARAVELPEVEEQRGVERSLR
jgi:hypothetical protein